MRRRLLVCLVVVVVVYPWTLVPAVVREQHGQALIYRVSRQDLLHEAVAWILACTAGVVMSRSPARRPLGIVIAGFALFFPILALPQLWFTRVVITPTAIQQDARPWFAPTPLGFRYADVESISIETRPGRGHAGPRRAWVLHLVKGGSQEIDPADLWERNENEVVALLRGYGVRFR